MVCVTAKDGEHIEKLLRRFKRKVDAAGILKEVRQREHFLKPSVRRKLKQAAAKKRRIRNAKRAASR